MSREIIETTETPAKDERLERIEKLKEEVAPLQEKILALPEIASVLTELAKLSREQYPYHNVDHTVDVVKSTILLAYAARESEEVITHQALGAVWHDYGYLFKDKENESVAVEKFNETPVYASLPESVRDDLNKQILDTQVVPIFENKNFVGLSIPRNYEETRGYINDADVLNFGREDFMEKGQQIAQEGNKNLSDLSEMLGFYKTTLTLIESYRWRTKIANELFEEGRIKNIALLKKKIEETETALEHASERKAA